jgi:hypothetical protein
VKLNVWRSFPRGGPLQVRGEVLLCNRSTIGDIDGAGRERDVRNAHQVGQDFGVDNNK